MVRVREAGPPVSRDLFLVLSPRSADHGPRRSLGGGAVAQTRRAYGMGRGGTPVPLTAFQQEVLGALFYDPRREIFLLPPLPTIRRSSYIAVLAVV